MALSGDYTLDLSLNDVLIEAFDHLQIGADGETLTGDMLSRATRTLNFMIKAWEGQGIHLWTYKEGTLFPVVGTNTYDFSTAKLSNTWYETTTSAAAASGASEVVVTSATNVQASDNIQILFDDNTAQWTTVNGAPAGTTVTLTDVLTGDVLSGAKIRTFRDTFVPVYRIKSIRRRDSSTSETPIIFESRPDYFDQVNKNESTEILQAYYSRQETSGILYTWGAPSSAVPVLNFTYERKFQIMTEPGDFYDFPDYWFEALAFNLAYRLIPKYGCTPDRAMIIKSQAVESLNNALSADTEIYPINVKMSQ